MFSQVEENYIKALINTYKKQGYKYYLCHTITENNNEYDICLYVSKEEIKEVTSSMFDVTKGVCIHIDTSARNDTSYNPSVHSRDKVVNDNVTEIVQVNQAEFIYTNAVVNVKEGETIGCVNPDLMLQGTDSLNSFYTSTLCVVVLIITFLYTFFANILRIRR